MKEHRVREILLSETPGMEKRIFERIDRKIEEMFGTLAVRATFAFWKTPIQKSLLEA